MVARNLYTTDRAWADHHNDRAMTILYQILPYLVKISIASDTKDRLHATDFTLRLEGCAIAVRLRRATCSYRDLTIRAKRTSGAKTELDKIREGHASHYFYGWLDHNNALSEWILVDLNKLRASGLLEKERLLIPNADRSTFFISIKLTELQQSGCLIKHKTSGGVEVEEEKQNCYGSLARAR